MLKPFIELKEENTIGTVIWDGKQWKFLERIAIIHSLLQQKKFWNHFWFFFQVCIDAFDRSTPHKRKYRCGNSKPVMTKTLSMEIMQRTRLRSSFLKNLMLRIRNLITRKEIYIFLLRKDKRRFFANLNENRITENKTFWQTVKPSLSDKNQERITLIKKDELVSQEKKVAYYLVCCRLLLIFFFQILS